jgi:midasin
VVRRLAAYGAEVRARCEALTSGLSSELTEQLRLILEPTLASKMAGDYKTGKRINMKKVIAYIASHFRKDKIWMRRARPDKRRYQIVLVLAVNDSRSMAENGCGGVALEALAVISKSMSRLEVGQVGVLKFGGADGVVPLQPLDAPFSDAVGPRLASSLRFQGESTTGRRRHRSRNERPLAARHHPRRRPLPRARGAQGGGARGRGAPGRVPRVPRAR